MTGANGSRGRGERTILIVDDHPLFRRALRDVLDAQVGLRVCAEAEGAPEAVDIVRRLAPDLAIVDLSLAEGSGLELIKCLRALDPEVRLLVVSVHDESLFARRALQAGALGYVSKAAPAERIVAAVRDVLAGRVALSHDVAQRVLRGSVGRGDATPERIEALSDRELEVLGHLGRGLSTRRVSEQLQLSVKTVETYREKLKAKLDLADGTDLVRFAAIWAHEQASGGPPRAWRLARHEEMR